MHFLLFYAVTPDYLERRGEFRGDHLKKVWAAHYNRTFVLGGALQEPLDTARLLFSGDSKEVVEEFARTNPYVMNELVKSWKVCEWKTVGGALAMTPVHPAKWQ